MPTETSNGSDGNGSAGADDGSVVIYRHVACPYCERVVRVADALGVEYRSRYVVPTHSERDHVKRISGGRAVPVLVDERAGVTMPESANIVDYLERTYGGADRSRPSRPGGDFDVVDLPAADLPEVGEVAPDFTRPLVGSEFWEDAALSDATERGPVLLVFHPMAGTGIATNEWITIRERGWGRDGDLAVLGVTISTPYAIKRFVDDHRLPYRLFADPANGVAERYGVVHDHDDMAGIGGPRPAHLLLDSERRVRYAWAASEWPERGDYDAVEDAVESL